MSAVAEPRLAMAPQDVVCTRAPDGSMYLSSPQPLEPHARTVSEWLEQWASVHPTRVFLAERDSQQNWRELNYQDALTSVRRIAQGLLAAGLTAERPLMVLSENSIDSAKLSLAAMHVGIPVVPVSAAYSLMDPSLDKLRHISGLVCPGMVYAGDSQRYAKALAVVGAPHAVISELEAHEPSAQVASEHEKTGPDTLAKILFTSGSTGHPKGVMNTQRMLTASQQQSLQVWRFVEDDAPVVVDWLPWNHTFGGNYNFNLVLSTGGTLYIDAGKPVPGLFDLTIKNLKEVAPTMYFNVPRGFDLLLPKLENDPDFCSHFFSRCRFVFYAAAALPQSVYDAFMRLARRERGEDFMLVSAWGATETAPLCTAVHYPIEQAGIVGLPVPGLEVKLVPNGGKLEARVRGPNITPGYYRDVQKTAQAFDDEGYYCMGDALRFDDPNAPEKGLVFDGRVAEDFKLASGTWVNVGKLRVQLLSSAKGLIQDAVLTGHDRDEIGALVFLHPSAGGLGNAEAMNALRDVLKHHNESVGSGSSVRITRALILKDPPSIEHGEITDKGYINQRFVLQRRASEVSRLYAKTLDTNVAAAQ